VSRSYSAGGSSDAAFFSAVLQQLVIEPFVSAMASQQWRRQALKAGRSL